MPISWRQGNLLDSRADILVNPVNCIGVSGAGLAKQFALRHPTPTRAYQHWCQAGELKPGILRLCFPVLYFPTKTHWKYPSRLQYIEQGLEFFRDKFLWKLYNSYAFPPLGCGLGGLKWEEVKPLLVRYLNDLTIEVEVYEPNAHVRLQVSERPRV